MLMHHHDGGSNESVSALIRLESENLRSVLACRLLIEAMKEVMYAPSQMERVVAVMHSIARAEPIMLAELMEQMPQLAVMCEAEAVRDQNILGRHILPLVLRSLSDSDAMVQKTAQATLLMLIEQDLILHQVIEEEVCPVVVTLTNFCQTNGIMLMRKLAQYLGRDATERLFLDKFAEACYDEDKQSLRETCAKSFGELCSVLGVDITEKRMIPLYCRLCRDDNWAVRKACAEIAMLVSCAVTMETRRSVLTTHFLDLLSDGSFWVRIAAFQVLGAFISTFASPPVTRMAYDKYGELLFLGPEDFEFRLGTFQIQIPQMAVSKNLWYLGDMGGGDGPAPPPPPQLEDADAFNTFRFWQLPVLEVDSIIDDENIRADLTSLDNELTSLSEKLDKCSSKELEIDSIISDSSTPDSGWNSGVTTPSQPYPPPLTLRLSGSMLASRVRKRSPHRTIFNKPTQDVVPQRLLDRFLQMAQPSHNADVDKELALQAAYFLPAVAFTLGKENWPWISDLYHTLALDLQWKVRRTVASSLHELARIVGEETTSRDLAPILKNLMKDLNEVRIGAVQHLCDTLILIEQSVRNTFLPLLNDLLETDADKNWRFREELAAQLASACLLFSPSDCLKHIAPLAFSMLGDRVAAVRKKSLYLMTELIKLLVGQDLLYTLLSFIYDEFSENRIWSRRMVFSQLCTEICVDGHLDPDVFCANLLPFLLRLAKDVVPNIRISVARCLTIAASRYIPSDNTQFEEIIDVLRVLATDEDSDVRQAASQILDDSASDPNDTTYRFELDTDSTLET